MLSIFINTKLSPRSSIKQHLWNRSHFTILGIWAREFRPG